MTLCLVAKKKKNNIKMDLWFLVPKYPYYKKHQGKYLATIITNFLILYIIKMCFLSHSEEPNKERIPKRKLYLYSVEMACFEL